MWFEQGAFVFLSLVFGGCAVSSKNDNDAGDLSASCHPGATLTGAVYDMAKSRFAIGSSPVRDDSVPTMTRWVGSDGIVAIEACGSELGIMNAGASETDLPDWSSDSAALSSHVRDYFESMGVQPCQIAATQVFGSGSASCTATSDSDSSCQVISGSRSIYLSRAVDGISVVESQAYARFNVNDQSTSEGLYWPTISADTVTAARSFRTSLADPAGLAAYKAKLPATAQGDGQVVIHHSNCFSGTAGPMQSAATYDVLQNSPMGMAGTLSFDADGNPVTTIW
jgi:hypothetical protein